MSERSISTSLPISELITHVKHSFRERDFNEVQNILMGRENDMKKEMENLTRDRDLAKKEICSLERKMDLKVLEMLKLDEKLQKSQRKCEDLEEKVTRLLEEKKLSDDREKRADERYCKIEAENLKLAIEKNKSVSELIEKVNELKNKNLENERLVGVYQEKCKCLDTEIAKMAQEIEDLRLKQAEGEQVVEGLKGEVLEANRTIDELRLKKSESDKAAELYKNRLDKLWPRIKKIEEDHADMLTVKVGNIAGLANDVRKNDSSLGNTEVVVLSRGLGSASNSNGSRFKGSISKKGDRNLVQCSTREDDAHIIKNSPGSQSGCNPPQVESNKCKDLLVSGAHGSGTRSISGAGRFSKTARSSPAGGEIVQIIDSDDEEKHPARAPDLSNVGENEINSVRSPVSTQQSKRKNQTDCVGDLYANSTTKRKKDTCTKDENIVLVDEEKNNGLKDEVSTDSDESYTDSKMEDFIASLGSKKLGRKFVYEADMLRAFQQDDELCMNAVCALYRQQVAARKSKGGSSLPKNGGFSPVDSLSGCALAEYLIDGDKELRLRKSVSEVKKQRPDVITHCRKLANIYIEKLFEIHRSGKDHLFDH